MIRHWLYRCGYDAAAGAMLRGEAMPQLNFHASVEGARAAVDDFAVLHQAAADMESIKARIPTLIQQLLKRPRS